MSACSWHNSTKARHVGKFKTQLHTKPLWFLSLLVHYLSISDWESVRLYGQGFRYCPKQNGNSHRMCWLQTNNGKVEEIKHRFATLTRDKSSIFLNVETSRQFHSEYGLEKTAVSRQPGNTHDSTCWLTMAIHGENAMAVDVVHPCPKLVNEGRKMWAILHSHHKNPNKMTSLIIVTSSNINNTKWVITFIPWN